MVDMVHRVDMVDMVHKVYMGHMGHRVGRDYILDILFVLPQALRNSDLA